MSGDVRSESSAARRDSRIAVLVHRLVVVQPDELPALLAAFATLFCMLFSYSILRPIRDTMGIASGVLLSPNDAVRHTEDSAARPPEAPGVP